VAAHSMEAKGVLDLSEDSAIQIAVGKIMEKLGI